jgi:hypothetical protein
VRRSLLRFIERGDDAWWECEGRVERVTWGGLCEAPAARASVCSAPTIGRPPKMESERLVVRRKEWAARGQPAFSIARAQFVALPGLVRFQAAQ